MMLALAHKHEEALPPNTVLVEASVGNASFIKKQPSSAGQVPTSLALVRKDESNFALAATGEFVAPDFVGYSAVVAKLVALTEDQAFINELGAILEDKQARFGVHTGWDSGVGCQCQCVPARYLPLL